MPDHDVTDIDALTAIYGEPAEASLRKVTDRLTAEYAAMIEAAPFCAVATSGDTGLDCSPRGDDGQVAIVLSPDTIAMPDRRGNNRLDTLRNLVTDPRCALLFLIPGVNETLRINGTACVTTDPALRARFAFEEKEPATIILVKIEEVYFQCARALIRSRLWDSEKKVTRATLPSAGQMVRAAFDAFDAETYDAALPQRQKDTLY